MNAIVNQPETVTAEFVVDDIFLPTSTDLIDGLIAQYRSQLEKISTVSGIMQADEYKHVIQWFLDGIEERHSIYNVGRLFEIDGAKAALNASYWQQALGQTDVFNCMPQKRRDEWNELIQKKKAPEFKEDVVRDTINHLLSQRMHFLSERVDGIFRALSREHVTNSPSGFNKRMIIANATNNFYHSDSQAGHINDLRAVIAKFMGRDDPHWNSSRKLIELGLRRHGEWMTIDGGALKMRVYLKGTAHLEIHPDIAWRLNEILAFLHPRVIPSEFRTKPIRKSKEFPVMQRPLPFAVLEVLSSFTKVRGANHYKMDNTYAKNKLALVEARQVLQSIGGVAIDTYGAFNFDYDPMDIVDEIISSGCVPDQKSHQFYPTLTKVADDAINFAEILDDDDVLEPSAGQGGISTLLPETANLTLVEISKLHCDILRAKHSDADIYNEDFIAWATKCQKRFDRIIMNPPFSEGRANLHVSTAAKLLKREGRLVAVLPASFKDKSFLDGFNHTWSDVYCNEFAGTSVSVVILIAERGGV